MASDSSFWIGPWVLASGTPLRGWHNDGGQQLAKARVPIGLDDGSTGWLTVSQEPCTDVQRCGGSRDDCGCFEFDSYWITVRAADGHRVARLHLWAAYGIFDVVPVDLVDGRGDEIVIVRVPAHSSPGTGPDLKIWKVQATQPIDLSPADGAGNALPVAGYVETMEGAYPCARWRTRLVIDPESAKPRSIALRTDLGIYEWQPDGCHLNDEGAARVASLRGAHRLRFENGRYRFH
jgi:hypothetical protein